MTYFPLSRTCVSSAVALLAATLMAWPLFASAQEETSAVESTASSPAFEAAAFKSVLPIKLQIGDATRSLLSMQREGDSASSTPRPLAGDVASLSYQRYLDSFKHAIPEKFTTTVSKSGSSNSSSSK